MIFLFSNLLNAQENPNIKWTLSSSKNNNSFYVDINADIKENWYLYGINIEDGGPLPLLIQIEDSDNSIEKQEIISKSEAHTTYDELFKMDVETYKKNANFQLIYKPTIKKEEIIIIIDGQICNSLDGQCEAIYQKIKVKTNY